MDFNSVPSPSTPPGTPPEDVPPVSKERFFKQLAARNPVGALFFMRHEVTRADMQCACLGWSPRTLADTLDSVRMQDNAVVMHFFAEQMCVCLEDLPYDESYDAFACVLADILCEHARYAPTGRYFVSGLAAYSGPAEHARDLLIDKMLLCRPRSACREWKDIQRRVISGRDAQSLRFVACKIRRPLNVVSLAMVERHLVASLAYLTSDRLAISEDVVAAYLLLTPETFVRSFELAHANTCAFTSILDRAFQYARGHSRGYSGDYLLLLRKTRDFLDSTATHDMGSGITTEYLKGLVACVASAYECAIVLMSEFSKGVFSRNPSLRADYRDVRRHFKSCGVGVFGEFNAI